MIWPTVLLIGGLPATEIISRFQGRWLQKNRELAYGKLDKCCICLKTSTLCARKSFFPWKICPGWQWNSSLKYLLSGFPRDKERHVQKCTAKFSKDTLFWTCLNSHDASSTVPPVDQRSVGNWKKKTTILWYQLLCVWSLRGVEVYWRTANVYVKGRKLNLLGRRNSR